MDTQPKEKPVCAKCGSANVTRDAITEWDGVKWVVSDVLDNSDCGDCQDECDLKWVSGDSLPGNEEKTGVADVVEVPKVSEGLGLLPALEINGWYSGQMKQLQSTAHVEGLNNENVYYRYTTNGVNFSQACDSEAAFRKLFPRYIQTSADAHNPKLESCPFCSGELVHRGFMVADPKKHYRECMDCLAYVGGYDTPVEADAAWNRRDSNGLPLMGQGYCITDSCENIVGKKGELCAYCANDDAAILSFMESGVTSLALADGGTIYFEPATEECDNRWCIDGSTESFDSLSDVIRAHFLGGGVK